METINKDIEPIVKDGMEFVDSFYFHLNKSLLEIVGLWPYQNSVRKWLARLFFMSMMSSLAPLVILQFMEAIKNNSIASSFECLSFLAYLLSCVMKLVCSILSEKQQKSIIEGMCEDWKIITDKDEVEELKRYSMSGKRVTILYLVYMTFALSAYVGIPFVPQLLDVIIPLNQSRPRIFIVQAQYFVDTEIYFYHVACYDLVPCICSVVLFIATDSTYMYCVSHLCARFIIVELRLIKSLEENTRPDTKLEKKDNYNDVVKAIISHQKAIEFLDLIESSYFMNFLFVIGLGVLAMSATAFRLLLNTENQIEMVRIALFNAGQVIHLFCHSWPGQQVMDFSSNIFRSAYICNWMSASRKTKQVLCILMLRSSNPSKLTAGKLYVMSMENFSSVLKTTMSYFTLFASLR